MFPIACQNSWTELNDFFFREHRLKKIKKNFYKLFLFFFNSMGNAAPGTSSSII